MTKLTPGHDITGFACGQPDLDRFLARHALASSAAGGAQTYVAALGMEYEHFDFAPSPSDPLHLFVLVKDLRRLMTVPTMKG